MKSDPGDRSQSQKYNSCRMNVLQQKEETFQISAGQHNLAMESRPRLQHLTLFPPPGALVSEGGPFSSLSAVANPGSQQSSRMITLLCQ